MGWLVSRNELTSAQVRAVEMDAKQHRLVLGSPGSGKTLVLLHRARHLVDKGRIPPARYRLLVFTNALKAYISTALDDLALPAGCVMTFDAWCQGFYRQYVDRTLPRGKKGPDFGAVRQAVWKRVRSASCQMPLYDFVMVDEGQDLDARAYAILITVAAHVTVFMDHKQQIYENGIEEHDLLTCLGLPGRTSTLLDAYRCAPYIVQTAAAFIADPTERSRFIYQNPPIEKGERQPPLLYLARDREDERDHLVEVMRARIDKGERIALLFPTRRLVFGYARGLNDAGVEVEVPAWRISGSRSDLPSIDFGTLRPKAMAYPSAKGLTFDTVLMPCLETGNFSRVQSALRENWLFVGVSRAVRWLCFSAREGRCMFLERFEDLAGRRQLTIQRPGARGADARQPVPGAPRPDPTGPTDLSDLF